MLLKKGEWNRDQYDAVVIGGGIGGLTMANILANNGKKILLLESHNKLGGLATWFRRSNRYLFDVSLHGFPSGMIKTCRRHWSKKISDSIIPLREMRFINPQFRLSTDYTKKSFIEILEKNFRIPTNKINHFFQHLEIIKQKNIESLTIKEVFEQHFPNRTDVLRFLIEPIAYANGHTLEDPALTFSIVFLNFMKDGFYTVQGGTDSLIGNMKSELLKNDVDIKLNTKVVRIVTTQKGRFISSNIVVSNAHLFNTVKSLVGLEYFSEEYKENFTKVKLNPSSCQVYIGLKEKIPFIGDLIFHSSAKVFSTKELLSPSISCRTFSIYYPHLRPEINQYTIVASINSLYSYWAYLDKEEYQNEKEKMINNTLKCLREILPDIDSNIDYISAATPITIKKYTSHPEGASFGTKYEGLESSINISNEIRGLYHCGSVGIIMSGWLGAANYAVIVANKIESQLNSIQNNKNKLV